MWRSSEGVRGNLHAGPTTGIRCDALAIRRLGLLRTKTKKLRGEHEGIRIGPLTGRVGRGRASMADTRRAKARRRFRNRRFRYVTRAAGRGRRCRHGGNLEGTDNRKEPKQNPGNRMFSTVSGVPIRAEDTRFELHSTGFSINREKRRHAGKNSVIPTVPGVVRKRMLRSFPAGTYPTEGTRGEPRYAVVSDGGSRGRTAVRESMKGGGR